jgi:glycosyltransferase involved in cell wall biosynthesis
MKDRTNIIIALPSLAAEGTPRLVLELYRNWLPTGLRPVLVVLESEPTDLAPDFEALGVKPIFLGMSKKGYWRYLKLAIDLFVIARRHRAAALLSWPLGWHTFMALAARTGGVRRVIAHAGNYPNSATGTAFRKFRFLVQAGRPFTDKIVCCSNYVQEGIVEQFGVPKARTAVVYNGVPTDTFAARASQARSERQDRGPVVIGMVARLEVHKDQPTLIRAARILRGRGLPVEVRLIGEGRRRKEFEALVQAEGITDCVKLLGMRRDVPELVGQLDIFAFSTTPDEGLGIALIEAMAAGVPIVASDVMACREVLDDGALGKLVPADDPVALADAIQAVHADPVTAGERARKARDKASRTFSMEKMADSYAALLELPHVSAQPEGVLRAT